MAPPLRLTNYGPPGHSPAATTRLENVKAASVALQDVIRQGIASDDPNDMFLFLLQVGELSRVLAEEFTEISRG